MQRHLRERPAPDRRRRRARGCASRCPRRRGTISSSAGRSAGTPMHGEDERASRPRGQRARASRPRRRVRSAHGAESVRRRLSIIFQRPSSGHAAPRAGPRIQGRSCQSPRAQRCWRSVATCVVRRELLEERRGRSPARRARRCPRRGRGSGARSPARARRAPPRRRRRRRCPCRCRTPRRRDPGRRPRPPRRRDRCRSGPADDPVVAASPSRSGGSVGVTRGCSTP